MSQPKQGNYFMLPNEIFNMDLTAEEIALYAFLMRMEDRKTFTCYPAFKTIGEALKMGSKNTVITVGLTPSIKAMILTVLPIIFAAIPTQVSR